MAIGPRTPVITRDDVTAWIQSWKKSDQALTLEDYIRAQISNLRLKDDQVKTEAHEDLNDTTPIADMIIMDLLSYG